MKLRKHIARAVIFLVSLSSAACVSLEKAAPPVELLTVSSTGRMNIAQLSLGRDIYITRCAKCHSVEPVTKYSRVRWEQEILPKMAEKTKLTAVESDTVEAYVLMVLASGNIATR